MIAGQAPHGRGATTPARPPRGRALARRRGPGLGTGALVLVLVVGLGLTTPARAEPTLGARLPAAPGRYGPSLLELAGGAGAGGVELADVETCATCHAAVAAQWQASAHSFASFGNPIYRSNVAGVRAALGAPATRHCGGCHDLPLMIDDAMPTGDAGLAADDLRAHQGVSCRVCHGVRAARVDGNGSYTLDAATVPTPTPGDAASLARHRAATSVRALGAELCVSCHRGFLSPDLGLPAHLSGIDEPTAWRGSPYQASGTARIDAVAARTCVDCHMPEEAVAAAVRDDEASAGADGRVRSHRVVGGHTWMAAMRGDADHVARTQAALRDAVTLDVAALGPVDASAQAPPGLTGWVLPAERGRPGPGAVGAGGLAVDVVIRNAGVGHRFPGGVLDMHDTWLEVALVDGAGRALAGSGLRHAADPDDDEAHVLRTLVVDEDGRVLRQHELARFRAVIANHTLAPREAQVVRFVAPAELLRGAAAVTVRLRHRSRTLHQQAVVCAESRTPVGRAFARGTGDYRDVVLDPCRPQPITELASARLGLDGAGPAPSPRPAWVRVYEHGMALTAAIGERAAEAEVVLRRALALVLAGPAPAPAAGGASAEPAVAPATARAMVLVQLAAAVGRLGRTDEALTLLAWARVLAPRPTPAAIPALAAELLARVWRWQEAAPLARAVVERAPGNTGAHVALARALSSLGDDAGALRAAHAGLALAPREPELLRVQAIALAALEHPDAPAALAAFDRFRAPDVSSELRIACARQSPVCAREREGAHAHLLSPSPPVD